MADEELRALERFWREKRTWDAFLSWARACERNGRTAAAELARLVVRWDVRDRRADRVILYRARHGVSGPAPRFGHVMTRRAERIEEVTVVCEGAAAIAHDATRRRIRALRREGIPTMEILRLEGAPHALTRWVHDAARRKRERREGRDRTRRIRGRICASCEHPLHVANQCSRPEADGRCRCVDVAEAHDGWIPAEGQEPRPPAPRPACPDCPHPAHVGGSCGGVIVTAELEGTDPGCPCETSSAEGFYGVPSWVRDGMDLVRSVAPARDVYLDGDCLRCGHGSHDGRPCTGHVYGRNAGEFDSCPCPSLGSIGRTPADQDENQRIFRNDGVPELSIFLPTGATLTAEQEARIRQALLDARTGNVHRTLVLDLPEGARVYRNGGEVPAGITGFRHLTLSHARPFETAPWVPSPPGEAPIVPIFPTTGTPVVHDGNAWAAGQTITLEGESPPHGPFSIGGRGTAPPGVVDLIPITGANCPRCGARSTVSIGSAMTNGLPGGGWSASFGSCSACLVHFEFLRDGTYRAFLDAERTTEFPRP